MGLLHPLKRWRRPSPKKPRLRWRRPSPKKPRLRQTRSASRGCVGAARGRAGAQRWVHAHSHHATPPPTSPPGPRPRTPSPARPCALHSQMAAHVTPDPSAGHWSSDSPTPSPVVPASSGTPARREVPPSPFTSDWGTAGQQRTCQTFQGIYDGAAEAGDIDMDPAAALDRHTRWSSQGSEVLLAAAAPSPPRRPHTHTHTRTHTHTHNRRSPRPPLTHNCQRPRRPRRATGRSGRAGLTVAFRASSASFRRTRLSAPRTRWCCPPAAHTHTHTHTHTTVACPGRREPEAERLSPEVQRRGRPDRDRRVRRRAPHEHPGRKGGRDHRDR